MIKILNTKSRNFQSKFDYYLNTRREYSESKINSVKRIVKDIRKKQDKSLINYEKKSDSLMRVDINEANHKLHIKGFSIEKLDSIPFNSLDRRN